MIKYALFLILCIPINYVLASDLPSSLFQIELGNSIHEIKNSNRTRMHGLYLIQTDEKQLVGPLKRLLVKVNKDSDRVEQIYAEGVISDAFCTSEAKKLKEEYEKSFSLRFETTEHRGDTLYTITTDKRFFFVGCKSRKTRTMLTVSLADTSNELSALYKQKNPWFQDPFPVRGNY